jgi:hypothetical protein
MAKRNTTHIIKNSNIVNRPLPISLQLGEPIVNTAEGILLFSGNSMSTNNWTPSNSNPNFFEVGSNLNDLKLRNKIISYQNISGGGLVGKFLSGGTNGFELADISSIVGVDTFSTGGTYSNGTLVINNNNGNSFSVSGFLTGLTDTYITGFTFNNTTNKITLSQNNFSDLNIYIDSLSGLSLTNLTENRLVYTTSGGKLITGNAIFDGLDLTLPNTGKLNVGSGGLIIGSGGNPNTPGSGDLIVNGNLTVFGNSFSAHTSELYVEDNNIILNFNPTGNTSSSSIGSGLTIQDGNGLSGGNVNLEVRPLNNFSLQNPGEYSGLNGYSNRGWVTQLNDIIIRSNNTSTPDGVRVLTELDELDGGQY